MFARQAIVFAFILAVASPLFAADESETKTIKVKRVVQADGVVVIETQAKKETKVTKKVKVVAVPAAGGAAIVVGARADGYSTNVRTDVDRNDPVERFLLLTPRAPLIVEATVTVDGKPFRHLREKLVDEMLVNADVDKDGKATWEEAVKSPRFTFGRFSAPNQQAIQNYIKTFDTNKDTLVDAPEARKFLAQYSGGPAFTVTRGYGYSRAVAFQANGRLYQSGNVRADVKGLLDSDKDGVLSAEEIAAAGERLKSRDADDNDLLYANEIAGSAQQGGRNVQVIRRGTATYQQTGILLGPAVQASAVFSALRQKYKNKDNKVTADSFGTLPGLFKQLDENKDGQLQQNEVLELNKVKPHIQIAVNLGKNEDAKPISLVSLDPSVEKSGEVKDRTISLKRPGLNLGLAVPQSRNVNYNFATTAERYMQRYDKDNNKYLDEKEMAGNLARQFKMWDADNDGRVYAKEITEMYTRMRAPQMSQVRAQVAEQGNSMFLALDETGDGRLSLREMRTAHEQLKTFDKNTDGQITVDEIPVTLSVNFSQGAYGYQYVRTIQARGTRTPNQPATTAGPEWFTRMDRNGDGDVTLKEFLGTEEQFKKLDTNGDGFIERKEAEAAEKK